MKYGTLLEQDLAGELSIDPVTALKTNAEVGSNMEKPDEKAISLRELRNAIPAHCFKVSLARSSWYLLRDIVAYCVFVYLAVTLIPLIPSLPLRFFVWAFYGWLAGLAFTGVWIVGHDAGHNNVSSNHLINHTVGWIIHSALMTPYFAWRSTHRHHHMYHNNIELDNSYNPPEQEAYLASFTRALEEACADAPLYVWTRIFWQQLIGWPLYLTTFITSKPGALPRRTKNTPTSSPASKSEPTSSTWLDHSHFAPWGALFRPEEAPLILLTDLGLLFAFTALFLTARHIGPSNFALLYLQPYIWTNHWIVAITYLHHTHPDLPKYTAQHWTYLRGALSTVDRDPGRLAGFFFHNVVDCHVAHHLFPRIPHYWLRDATEAIKPVLGEAYRESSEGVLRDLYRSFTKCLYVKPDGSRGGKEGTLWYTDSVAL